MKVNAMITLFFEELADEEQIDMTSAQVKGEFYQFVEEKNPNYYSQYCVAAERWEKACESWPDKTPPGDLLHIAMNIRENQKHDQTPALKVCIEIRCLWKEYKQRTVPRESNAEMFEEGHPQGNGFTGSDEDSLHGRGAKREGRDSFGPRNKH